MDGQVAHGRPLRTLLSYADARTLRLPISRVWSSLAEPLVIAQESGVWRTKKMALVTSAISLLHKANRNTRKRLRDGAVSAGADETPDDDATAIAALLDSRRNVVVEDLSTLAAAPRAAAGLGQWARHEATGGSSGEAPDCGIVVCRYTDIFKWKEALGAVPGLVTRDFCEDLAERACADRGLLRVTRGKGAASDVEAVGPSRGPSTRVYVGSREAVAGAWARASRYKWKFWVLDLAGEAGADGEGGEWPWAETRWGANHLPFTPRLLVRRPPSHAESLEDMLFQAEFAQGGDPESAIPRAKQLRTAIDIATYWARDRDNASRSRSVPARRKLAGRLAHDPTKRRVGGRPRRRDGAEQLPGATAVLLGRRQEQPAVRLVREGRRRPDRGHHDLAGPRAPLRDVGVDGAG